MLQRLWKRRRSLTMPSTTGTASIHASPRIARRQAAMGIAEVVAMLSSSSKLCSEAAAGGTEISGLANESVAQAGLARRLALQEKNRTTFSNHLKGGCTHHETRRVFLSCGGVPLALARLACLGTKRWEPSNTHRIIMRLLVACWNSLETIP
jgi:hypothetical protein